MCTKFLRKFQKFGAYALFFKMPKKFDNFPKYVKKFGAYAPVLKMCPQFFEIIFKHLGFSP
jgi:hypothetical protein